MPENRPSAASPEATPLHTHDVVLILAGEHIEIPGYWNLELSVREVRCWVSRDDHVHRRETLEQCTREAFEAHRDILADGNYRISLSGEPATIDFLEIMRAKLLVSEGQEPIQIVIAEDQDVVDEAPAPGKEPKLVERRVVYRRLGHPDDKLAEGITVFDLSEDGGHDASGAPIPVEIPGARVIAWRGLRNRHQLLHEAYADAAARSLIARAAHLGATSADQWGIYVGRSAQHAVAVLRGSRGFYAGRMIPILVREQWRKDLPDAARRWRPLGLRLLEHTRVA